MSSITSAMAAFVRLKNCRNAKLIECMCDPRKLFRRITPQQRDTTARPASHCRSGSKSAGEFLRLKEEPLWMGEENVLRRTELSQSLIDVVLLDAIGCQ